MYATISASGKKTRLKRKYEEEAVPLPGGNAGRPERDRDPDDRGQNPPKNHLLPPIGGCVSARCERPRQPPLRRGAAPVSAVTALVLLVLVLRDLDRDLERVGDLARRGGDARRADDRCDRGQDAADLLGVDADLDSRLRGSAGTRPPARRPRRAPRCERASASPGRGSMPRGSPRSCLPADRGPGSRWSIRPYAFLSFDVRSRSQGTAQYWRPRSPGSSYRWHEMSGV